MIWLFLASVVLLLASPALADESEEKKGPAATAEVQVLLDEAERLRGKKDAEAALAVSDRALALARESNDATGGALASKERAIALELLGRSDDALAAWRETVSAWESQGVGPERIEALGAMAVLCFRVRDTKAGTDAIERVLRIAELEEERPVAGARLMNATCEALWKMGQLAMAERLAKSAFAIAEAHVGASLIVASSLNHLGVVAAQRGNLEAAREHFSRSLEFRERHAPGSLDVAASLNNLGAVAWTQGDLKAAYDYHLRSLELKEQQAPGTLDVAASLVNLGNVAWRQGDLDVAEDYFRRALEIQERHAPDSLPVAVGLNSLGTIARAKGEIDSSWRYFLRALQIRERESPGSLSVAETLNNLGVVASDRGDFDAANDYYRRALEIREELAPSSLAVANSLNTLGMVAFDQRDLDAAGDYFGRALEIRHEHAPSSLSVAASLNNLGLVALHQDDLETARDYHGRALEIQEKQGSLQVAVSESYLGLVASERGDFDAARDHHRRALEIDELCSPGSLDVAVSLSYLGKVAFDQQDIDAAREFFARAWSVVRQQAHAVTGDEARLAFTELHGFHAANLIRAEVAGDHPERALAVFEESRAQGLLELLHRRGLERSAASVLWRAFKKSERRRDQLGESLAEASSRVVVLERDFSDLQAQGMTGEELAPAREMVSQAQSSRDDALANYTQARVEMQSRLAEIRRSVPGLEPVVVSDEAARKALPPATVFFAFSVGNAATTVIIVPSDSEKSVRGYVVDLTSEQLAKRVDFVRDRLGVGLVERGLALADKKRLENASRLLFRKLFPDNARRVLDAAERVVISPDGPLWDLPFAALDAGADEDGSPRWLGLEKSLSYAPSLTTLEHAKRRAASSDGDSILIVGDPMPGADDENEPTDGEETPADRETAEGKRATLAAGTQSTDERTRLFPNGVAPDPLPGAREEAKGLAKLYETEPLIGLDATESVVRERMREATIVHLATHGYFHPTHPMSSGVLLAPSKDEAATGTDTDGALQAWEILSALNLRADLVVLSACETGLGRAVRGEGLVGLTRALQAAGANSVVATHWKVADDSTTELMVSFHQKLRAGVRKDDALRQAMREVAGRAETSHPYFWAAFFLSGGSE